jgi:thiol:disulfide interchange protein DsbC
MNKFISALVALMVVIGLQSAALAASGEVTPETAFRKAFPQLKVDNIVESPVKGLYEVTSGPNFFYFYPDKELLLVGDIYSKEGKNLTGEKKQELKAKAQAESLKKLKDLPLEKAVKVGNGPKTVIEFTDPDCPYCRRASEALKGRTDITRYVFLTPLAHPNAITKVQYILSAKDQEKAYHEMMAGKPLPADATEFSKAVKDQAAAYMELARTMAIEGTPTFFINGQQVVGADMERIDNLLK